MSMLVDIIKDQENTIILLCQHMRKLITLLSAYTDMQKEEEFLDEILRKQGIDDD